MQEAERKICDMNSFAQANTFFQYGIQMTSTRKAKAISDTA